MKREPLGKLHKRNIETLAFMAVVLFLCSIISINRVNHIKILETENEDRMLLCSYAERIERGEYIECDYPYLIVSMNGLVLHENGNVLGLAGKKVNVEEILTVDESFLNTYGEYHKVFFTINDGDRVIGFSVFLLPSQEKKELFSTIMIAILPFLAGVVICIGLFLYQVLFSNHKVLKPIEEISDSAKAIIDGNYEKEVLRVYGSEVRADEVGQLTYSFELMRDELKAKQIKEEQLKKSQQELISCISHDLKTPISTIKAYSEGLRDQIARTEEDKKEYIQIILEKTNLLTAMISELLELSNAQLQQLNINRQELYVQEYLHPVLKELERYVTHNDIRFTATIMEENPIVTIDEKRITEVLYNLVENSMKYKNNKDAKISIIISRKEKDVLIRVIDNGTGINANDIPYVFDKFYRAEKSRSSNVPGSGLGLSICKYIIEQHGGEIYCKNLSVGCEFGFTIH